MTKVKVCGIRRVEDAQIAVKYGADALGLLVGQRHHSPDFISEETALEIIKTLPPFVSSVLVTHLAEPSEIVRIAKKICCTTIQLHGETTPEQTRSIKEELPYVKIYKTIHVTGEESISSAQAYEGSVDGILLDTISPATDQVGGTGKVHDWSISKIIVDTLTMPVILAGGLNSENVTEAIRQVRPYGVDANSGTKGNDGYKDPQKVKAFIENGHLEIH